MKGHLNESSSESYARDTPIDKRRQMTIILDSYGAAETGS